MKIAQLLESTDEPILLDIIRNLIAKGETVKVFYRGDGGTVTKVKWETNGRFDGGTSFFSCGTASPTVVAIADSNLEKLKFVKVETQDKHWWRLSVPMKV